MAWIIALQVSQLQHCQGLLHRNCPALSHRLFLCLHWATVHKHEPRKRKVYQIWRKLASYRLHQRKNEPFSLESEYAPLCKIGWSESLVAQVYETEWESWYRKQLYIKTSWKPLKRHYRDIGCFRIRPRTWPENVEQPEVIIAAASRAETLTVKQIALGFWYKPYSASEFILIRYNLREITGVFLGEGSTFRHNVFTSRVAIGPTLNIKLYQKLSAVKDGIKGGNDKQVYAMIIFLMIFDFSNIII